MSLSGAALSTKNEFSFQNIGQWVGAKYGARRNGSGSIIVSNIDANKLFNGAIFPASLDRFQNSHACPSPEAISCGCRADGARRALCPLNEAGACRPFFESAEAADLTYAYFWSASASCIRI